MSIRTKSEAIKYGYKNYYGMYIKAVQECWEHEIRIAEVPIEHWLIAQSCSRKPFLPKCGVPMGAKEIAQFVPGTAAEIGQELRERGLIEGGFDAFNVEQSIYAQTLYLNNLFGFWTTKRSAYSRLQLALASYNAGMGNILDAQRKALNARHWLEIREKLHYVTGKRAKETINYVSEIVQLAGMVGEISSAQDLV